MSATVRPAAIPPGGEINRHLAGAYFHDCYEMPLPAEDAGFSAMELSLQTFRKTPAWVDFLMGVRNRVVGLAGLKNMGALTGVERDKPAAAYRLGDRVGIFSLRYLSEDEVILGEDDKHLDVLVSVCKLRRGDAAAVAVTTVVHVHNWLGRCYMFFIRPAHKVIAPATLRSRTA
jgi:hypothetical protein